MAEQYGVDVEGFHTSKMVEGGPLKNISALMFALNEACKLYTDFDNPPPPIPDNVATFVPCSILVTDRHNLGTGERIGRIQFFRLDGTGLSDQTWTITKSRSSQ